MATLSSLKLSTAVKSTNMPAVQLRRNKLAKRLWEQAELARAQQSGTQFAPTKFRSVVDKDSGVRKQVEVNKRVQQWWFLTESGKMALSVRYGSKILELANNKYAVEIASDKELIPTLEIIKAAVLAGELDAQIESAAQTLRAQF